MNCLIPLWLTIIAADPCAAWGRFQDAFEVAQGRIYTANHIVEPAHDVEAIHPPPIDIPQDATLDDGSMGLLTYEEVDDPWPIGNGYYGHGEFVWPFASPPHIKVALNSPHRPPWHEGQHWILCVKMGRRSSACTNIGHGTDADPMINNLKRAHHAMMHPLTEAHSYYRKGLFQQQEVNWCEVKVEQ